MRKLVLIAAGVLYLIVAIFTFTYVYQRVEVEAPSMISAEEQRSVPAFTAGVLWPIYWIAHWAYRWTAPRAD